MPPRPELLVSLPMKLHHIVAPQKIRRIEKQFGRDRALKILDVGCGNHSPSLTKHWFPKCEYHGVDIQEYNLNEGDRRCIDKFFLVTAEGGGYEAIPRAEYDAVILNHVVEHLPDPQGIVMRMCESLRPGGIIYIAFPSERSLALPSAEGTLQFCDDPTHVYLPSVREVANWLLQRDVAVVYGGRSRDSIRALIGIPLYVIQLLRRLLGMRMRATGLWYILGFEACIVGIRKSVMGATGKVQ